MDFSKTVTVAAERIQPYIRKTPYIHSSPFSDTTESNVHFKLESFQVTGSFKVRGALNKILSLTNEERSGGVVSASTGNHGSAVAYASQQAGTECMIFVPKDASSSKMDDIKKFGADIEVYGSDCVQSEARAREVSAGTGKEYVSPYNDPLVMAGQGTIGLEIESQGDPLDVLIVSVGGGGLIGGTAGYLKSVWPNLHVIGCSPKNSAVMLHSIKAGRILDLESKPTLSDGTAGGVEENSITFPVCSGIIDESVLVSEAEIKAAMVAYMEMERQLLEGAAGTALAALLKKKDQLKGKCVGVVICGGNISLDTIRDILN